MTEHPIQIWHRLVRDHQPAGPDQLLAEAAVFFSPVVHWPQRGKHPIKWNEAGQVTEFKVMLRPFKAINLVHERMSSMLKVLQGPAPQ